MGNILNLKCGKCGNEWLHYEGSGFDSTYYYCDKCGKEKTTNVGVSVADESLQCECGGTFRIDNPDIICPVCQSKDVDNDKNTTMLWD
ncbi:hypothetical protein AGMMS50262_08640 [Bacteroidia bacterium]|nr:hypothetical protein FACS189440_16860 [Bacteroidia bacterium]GHT74858.1 hypothetical protein AGMMS50262_08640 [Bacteroidia bacterium]